MQVFTAIILMLTQMSGPMAADINNSEYVGLTPEIVVTAPRYEYEDNAWTGLMPEVVVTAPRHENEDDAWTGLMPEVVCTAPRHENEDDAWTGLMPEVVVVAEEYETYEDNDAFAVANTDYQNYNTQTFHLDLGSKPGFAYADAIFDVEIIPCGKTFRGDYHLPEGDTIDEDVTVTGGNAEIDGVINGDLTVMGGEVDVNGVIDGDIAVMGGNLDILGTITGDGAVFGGHIRNKGTMEGDLFVVGGTVSLDSGSVIEGNISMVGGSVDRDENAEVFGEIESVEMEALQKVLPRIGKAFRFPRMFRTTVFPRLFFIALFVVLYVLCLLVLLIFPKAIDRIGEKIQQNVWASVGFGLGMEILFIPLIVFFAVSIIGIPLIVLLPIAVTLGILFGVSALSLIFGDRVAKGLNWKVESRVGIFSLGWLSIMIIPILTYLIGPPIFPLGAFIMYVAATIGLGGVIYALVRRKPKESKK